MSAYRDRTAGSEAVRRSRVTKLRVIGTSLATAIVLFFLGRYIWENWQRIRTADVHLDLGWLILSVAMLGVYFVGRASVWHFLTVRTGVAIPFREALVAWLYSQLGKYIPGKVFLFLGRLYFYAKRGESKALVLVAFVTETTATLIASLLTVLVAVALLDVEAVAIYRPLLFGGLTALVVLIHPAVLSRILTRASSLLGDRGSNGSWAWPTHTSSSSSM